MKNKAPVSLYELIVNGLKEAIENEKNKGKEILVAHICRHDDTNFKECAPLTDTQADMPVHMIHLNGNKFLGPRK